MSDWIDDLREAFRVTSRWPRRREPPSSNFPRWRWHGLGTTARPIARSDIVSVEPKYIGILMEGGALPPHLRMPQTMGNRPKST